MNSYLEKLKAKQWLWQGLVQHNEKNTIASGYQALDSKISGGFPSKGVIECKTRNGIGEIRLFLNYLIAQQSQGLIVLISPPANINSEFLQHNGIHLDKVIVVNAELSLDALWSTEQCLKSGCVSSVLLWQEQLSVHQVRRLSLACEQGSASLIIFRQLLENIFNLPVQLSLSLQAHRYGLQISIDKQKGGKVYPEFSLDMTQQWPDLSLARVNDNVVHLNRHYRQVKG